MCILVRERSSGAGLSSLGTQASGLLKKEQKQAGRLRTHLQFQKVFQNSSTVRMLFIEEFGMELNTEEWSRGVLHRLNV